MAMAALRSSTLRTTNLFKSIIQRPSYYPHRINFLCSFQFSSVPQVVASNIEARELRLRDYFQVPNDDAYYRVITIDTVERGRGGKYYKFTLHDLTHDKMNVRMTLSPGDKCKHYEHNEIMQLLDAKNKSKTQQTANNAADRAQLVRPAAAENYDEKISYNFLYSMDHVYHLMHPNTFEQIEIDLNSAVHDNTAIDNPAKFSKLTESSPVTIQKHKGKIVGIITEAE
jgi:translation elongation factor P/translation initiation factor 5A